MKLRLTIILPMLLCLLTATAQEKTVQNRPYTDLRKFHFGLLIGSHLQDMEFVNVGPQTITLEDGTTEQGVITVDEDRWDPGFQVGVLGEFRLSTYFQFRIAPSMYFGTRHFTFHDFRDGHADEQRQELKSVYFSTAFDLIAAAPRFNNYRPYLMLGVNPMYNLRGKSNDFLAMKRSDCYIELGVGCDFYLQYFKLRPELKFMFGLSDCLDKDHTGELRDSQMIPFANSVNKAKSRIIALTFYFE